MSGPGTQVLPDLGQFGREIVVILANSVEIPTPAEAGFGVMHRLLYFLVRGTEELGRLGVKGGAAPALGPMARSLSLSRCSGSDSADVYRGRGRVADAAFAGPLDPVAVVPGAFHGAGTGSFPAAWDEFGGDVGADAGEHVVPAFRGEKPPYRWRCGGRCAGPG